MTANDSPLHWQNDSQSSLAQHVKKRSLIDIAVTKGQAIVKCLKVDINQNESDS